LGILVFRCRPPYCRVSIAECPGPGQNPNQTLASDGSPFLRPRVLRLFIQTPTRSTWDTQPLQTLLVFTNDERAVLDSKCPLTNFHSYKLEESIVFAFAGDHDHSTIPETEPRILAATNGQPHVVFDLSNANFVDSSMIALLIRHWKALGRRMEVVVPAACKARRLFSVTGLDAYFNLSETVADAVAPEL